VKYGQLGFFVGVQTVIFQLTKLFVGMRGWHWLFILEGIPAVLLGIACLFVLTDRPEQAVKYGQLGFFVGVQTVIFQLTKLFVRY
jgi:hypothetical protein